MMERISAPSWGDRAIMEGKNEEVGSFLTLQPFILADKQQAEEWRRAQ
jgi:hypothetical protein